MNRTEITCSNPVVSDYLDQIETIESEYTDDVCDLVQLSTTLKLYANDLDRRIFLIQHASDSVRG